VEAKVECFPSFRQSLLNKAIIGGDGCGFDVPKWLGSFVS